MTMFTLTIQYRTKHNVIHPFHSELVPLDEIILLLEDFQQTGRVKSYEIIDEHQSSWSLKSLKKLQQELAEEPQKIELYFDGNFIEATNEGGIGIVIYYEQNGARFRIQKNQLITHMTSNNEVEYAALYAAFDTLRTLSIGAQQLTVYGDSQVVIKQMSGDWPVYEENLAYWAEKVDQFLTKEKLTARYFHIPRTTNKEAHRLATQALEHTFIEATAKL